MSNNDLTIQPVASRAGAPALTIGGNVLRVKGTPFNLGPRPNDVTAYAIGDVMGAAADARIQLPAPPAFPSGFGCIGITLLWMQSRPAADSALTLNVIAFNGQPNTVLGDNVPLALVDADIAIALFQSNNALITVGNGSSNVAQSLNNGAAPAGRRYAIIGCTPVTELPLSAALLNNMWLYFTLSTTYVPLALETIVVTPLYQVLPA